MLLGQHVFQFTKIHHGLDGRQLIEINFAQRLANRLLLVQTLLDQVLQTLVNNALRYSRHLGDKQPVALVADSPLQLVRQEKRRPRWYGTHLVVAKMGLFPFQLGDGAVVCSEERLAADLRVDVLKDVGGDGDAFIHAGTSSQLVHENQRARRGFPLVIPSTPTILQDPGGLADLGEEGAAVVDDVVGAAHAREDLVDNAHVSTSSGNKTPHLRQDHTQRHGAKKGGFSAHVGSGDDARAHRVHVVAASQLQTVGDEGLSSPLTHHERFNDHMSHVLQSQIRIYVSPAVKRHPAPRSAARGHRDDKRAAVRS